MIKKYKNVRFLISLFLILISSFPLCASNSSSPDAFIRKEEFDEALSKFNNRLSTFESGVNSKIDLQVSSYLDRNGIWSKKQQSLKNSLDYFLYGGSLGSTYQSVTAECDLDGKTYNGLDFNTYIAKTQNTSLVYGEENVQVDRRITIVEKIDKSGMIVIEYAYAPILQAFRTWYKTNFGTNSSYLRFDATIGGNRASGGLSVVSSLGFEGVKTSGDIFDIKKDSFIRGGIPDGYSDSTWTGYYTVGFSGGTNTSMGFVDRGDKLDYVVKFSLVGNSANGLSAAQNASISTGDKWFTGMAMIVKDVNVY